MTFDEWKGQNTESETVEREDLPEDMPLYMLLASREVLLGTLRGYGETKIPMILSIAGMVGVRQIFLAITMHCNPVVENVYWCYPVGWGANALLLALYYYKKQSNNNDDCLFHHDFFFLRKDQGVYIPVERHKNHSRERAFPILKTKRLGFRRRDFVFGVCRTSLSQRLEQVTGIEPA